MFNKKIKKLNFHDNMSVEELNIHIRKFESDCKTVNRLHLIKQVMKTKNVGEACDYGYSYKNCL